MKDAGRPVGAAQADHFAHHCLLEVRDDEEDPGEDRLGDRDGRRVGNVQADRVVVLDALRGLVEELDDHQRERRRERAAEAETVAENPATNPPTLSLPNSAICDVAEGQDHPPNIAKFMVSRLDGAQPKLSTCQPSSREWSE